MKTNPHKGLLRELTHEEAMSCSGGIYIQIIRAVVISAIGAIINDWDNFKRGLTGQPEK